MKPSLTFQKYIDKQISEYNKKILILNYKKISLVGVLDDTLKYISGLNKCQQYDVLKHIMLEHYHALTHIIEFEHDVMIIHNMLMGFYELEEKCKNIEPIYIYDDNDIQMNKFKLLDENFEIYIMIVKKYIEILKPNELASLYFIAFAKLIYLFNGYQAPMSSNIDETLENIYFPENYINQLFESICK
jgi:hypothetical protein